MAKRMADLATDGHPRELTYAASSAVPPGRSLHIVVAGCMPRKAHRHKQGFGLHGIGLVVSGRGSYRVDGGAIQSIEPGCMFAVYPGPVFEYGPPSGATWEEYYFSPAGPGLSRWKKNGWFPTDQAVHPVKNVSFLIELFHELFDVLRCDSDGNADRAAAIAERLVIEMYYGRTAFFSGTGSVHDVIAYCQAHYAEAIDFEALANVHAISYSRLRHSLCEITGMPPAQYLAVLRCNAARVLLTQTELPIKAIAQRIGIEDPYSFSRVFKRHVGSSPLHYREQTTQWR